MKTFATLILLSMCVSSCAVGVRYSSPKDSEPYAVISGNDSYVYTFKEDGCPASYSYIKEAKKIHPSVPAFINYQEKIGSNHVCSMWFSFVPEAGATYKVQTSLKRAEKEKSSIFIPVFTGASCIAEVVKVDPNGNGVAVKLEKFAPVNKTCARNP